MDKLQCFCKIKIIYSVKYEWRKNKNKNFKQNKILVCIIILYSFRKTVKDITIEEGKKDKVIEQEVATIFICKTL